VRSHWDNYDAGKKNVGARADVADWRVARTVFVADDDKVAAAYGRDDPNSPYRFYYKQILTKLRKSNRHVVFKEEPNQPDDEITVDFVLERLCIFGTVNKVVEQILALREQTGDFGELVYAGLDWLDPGLARRSMELMAEQVMPRVNDAIRGR
jgi:alkanesulfonate monooxygenase SsuD/methylene tetrahydromethanopterin reductase-like flavin-dependent oxidoreductase (luciferase family)